MLKGCVIWSSQQKYPCDRLPLQAIPHFVSLLKRPAIAPDVMGQVLLWRPG